jgi:hypothetical protein
LAEALNHALRMGLTMGDPTMAHGAFMSRAAEPGLDIEGAPVYDIAVHHATLIETGLPVTRKQPEGVELLQSSMSALAI